MSFGSQTLVELYQALLFGSFLISLALTIRKWRASPDRVVTLAAHGALVVLGLTACAAITGVPVAMYRFGQLALHGRLTSMTPAVHHYLGRLTVWVFLIYWPVLVVASFRRPRSTLQRILLGAACVVCLYLFLCVSFTGYLLPFGLPGPLPPREAGWATRFVVLHIVSTPVIACVALALVAWRHARARPEQA